jgi:hypothetical protein
MRAIAISAALIGAVLGATGRPAAAEIVYPWCFHEVSEAGYVTCAFATYEQCMASRHGQSGFCIRNAAFESNAAAADKPRRRR